MSTEGSDHNDETPPNSPSRKTGMNKKKLKDQWKMYTTVATSSSKGSGINVTACCSVSAFLSSLGLLNSSFPLLLSSMLKDAEFRDAWYGRPQHL